MTKVACAVDEIERLTAGEAKAMLDKDKRGDFVVLDVRQSEEYEAGHIAGATLIPLGEMGDRQGELNRDKKFIIYCRSGRRAMAAAIALCGLGTILRKAYPVGIGGTVLSGQSSSLSDTWWL